MTAAGEGPVGPLDGILVADFTRVLAGPYATMLLADLGAEVIKVEGPGGDDTRGWLPPLRDGTSTYFLSINRNKRSVVLDLAEAADLAAAHELTVRADVVVQNFKPGGLTRFGLDYPAVAARNPAVVYGSISGFGTAGGADIPGYDLIVQAMSGLMSITGSAEGEPYRSGVAVFDVIAGLHLAIGVLAALRHRDQTGEGQHVEASLLASALSGMVNQTAAVVAGDVTPHRMGNAHPSLFPYQPMACSDGDLVVAVGNDGQFVRFCAVLGVPELVARFATNGARTAGRAELAPLLQAKLREHTSAHWFRELTAVGVPCGPINSVAEGVALAESLGLDPVVAIGEPAVPLVRHPLTFSSVAPTYRLPPPGLDADGAAIRAWLSS